MKYKAAITIYILILGLIPLLWFRGNQIITGTDVNFPPFPWERVEERFYAWEDLELAGAERSINISSLPYVGTSGLLNLFIKDVVTVEKLTFVIWFTLTGFSISYLLEKVFTEREEKERFLIKVFGILIYMVNFYNMFLWVRLQVSVTSLVFVPVLFGVLHSVLDKNSLKTKDLLILSVATILGGPLGKQPPVMYVILMSMCVYIGFYLSFDLFRNKKIILHKLKKLVCLSFVVAASGAYWIFPLGNYIFRSGLIQGGEAGVEAYNVKELLEWTSKTASNLNIFRMFGDVVWLDSWGGQFYFPEFVDFYQNPAFLILSFLALLVVFLALYVNKENKKPILAFGLIALMTIFFSKGTHPPFNSVFEWSFNNLPGFWIHRAPWQKFGLVTTMAYAVLGGFGTFFTVNFLHAKLKVTKLIIAPTLIGLYLLLNNLFVFGIMFPGKESDIGYHGKFDLGFHLTFPDYLYEARDYIKGLNKEHYNILLLPEEHTSVYDWGYGSSTDITWLFLGRSTLYSPYGEGFALDGYITNIYSAIVSALYSGNHDGLLKVFDFYNIDHILQRNDFRYDFYGDHDSPGFIKEKLSTLGLGPVTSFGRWDFYSIGEERSNQFIYTANNFVDVTAMKENILLPAILNDRSNTVLLEDAGGIVTFSETYLSSPGGFVGEPTLAETPYLPEVNVQPNSILYNLVRLKEKMQLLGMRDNAAKAGLQLWLASKRISEILKYDNLPVSKKATLYKDYLNGIVDYSEAFSNWADASEVSKYAFLGVQNIKLVLEKTQGLDLSPQITSELNKQLEIFQSLEIQEEVGCKNYCYNFNIKIPGSYEMFIVESNQRELPSDLYDIYVDGGSETSKNIYNLDSGNVTFSLSGMRDEPVSLKSREVVNPEEFTRGVGVERSEELIGPLNLNSMIKYSYNALDFQSKYLAELKYTSNDRMGILFVQKSTDGAGRVLLSSVLEPTVEEKIFEADVLVSNGVESLDIYLYPFRGGEVDVVSMNLLRQLNPNIILKSLNMPQPSGGLPEVVFKQLAPTKYLVKLGRFYGDGKFALVFNQTFSPHWKLYAGEGERSTGILSAFETLKMKEIANDKHFKSNFFSNTWYLDPLDVKGADFLIIEFASQRVFYIFAVVTAITLLTISTTAVFEYLKRRL
ncbi:hypothetical protein A2886_00855 [candidate division WWE3 bacterium RIFCSPHIGHO2_01_FULL_42_13]|uniref:Uncharacterized protein n=1 Tax=candidate division WWE3 bacterium RIFCSPHIGHO2_01_FULL_42_13 TaxID=1802617 RepID=A0A1F4UQV5_UNCKA|nr:MAG: hypothetical protein A2886_00855 [candidate division WWE3 bacterium RIFCSPHIGHO2_01_FULL_42_13]